MKNGFVKLAFASAVLIFLFALSIPGQDQVTAYVSSSEDGKYTAWNKSWQLPADGKGTITFTAKADNDIHVAISDKAQTKDPMYEIVIGGWGNSKSVIRRQSQGPEKASSEKFIKNPEQETRYWVSIDAVNKTIAAGYGDKPGEDIIVSWKDPKFITKSRYFSFSSWDSVVEFKNISVGP